MTDLKLDLSMLSVSDFDCTLVKKRINSVRLITVMISSSKAKIILTPGAGCLIPGINWNGGGYEQ